MSVEPNFPFFLQTGPGLDPFLPFLSSYGKVASTTSLLLLFVILANRKRVFVRDCSDLKFEQCD